jgi:TatD DNase family protein
LRVLGERSGDVTVVLHCFSPPDRLARWWSALLASFAGNVTYKNAPGLQAAAREVPAELLLLETDALGSRRRLFAGG